MVAGGVLASLAFVVSAIVQVNVDVSGLGFEEVENEKTAIAENTPSPT